MAAPRGLPSSLVQQGTHSGDHNSLLSAPSWRTVVRIPDELVTTVFKLFIQVIQKDVSQKW